MVTKVDMTEKIKEYDKQAGEHVFALRRMVNIDRSSVCKAIGVSQQQLHKYEHGINRMSYGTYRALLELLQSDELKKMDTINKRSCFINKDGNLEIC